jgi:hypothetical protein
MLEPLNKLRLPQSQIVQGLDERHQANFVRMPVFANANRTGSNNASEFGSEENEGYPNKNKRRHAGNPDTAV